MRYYLDTEFDGKGGPLLSLAIIREDGEGHYFVNPEAVAAVLDPWVKDNVVPVLTSGSPFGFHISDVGLVLSGWLRGDPQPVIIADWPDDVAYMCRELTARSLYWSDPNGQLYDMPPLRFEVANHDAYPTTLKSAVQHNAWWDAMALREKLSPAERPPLGLETALSTVPLSSTDEQNPSPTNPEGSSQ